MLRYRLAGPALVAHRIWRRVTGDARTGFRVLLLHGIDDRDRPAFERLIDYIQREHGFLTPAEAESRLRSAQQSPGPGRAGRAPCLLTFDDGFRSSYAVGRNVLTLRGIEAVFFICPGLLDLPDAEQKAAIAGGILDGRIEAGDLGPDRRLMSWDEVAELREMGHAIGNHGMSHRRLSDLSGDELRREVLDGADVLASRLGAETPWYAYAFGDIGSVSAEALTVIAEKHPLCRSGVRGLNTETTPPTTILADQIDADSPLAYQKLVVEGGLDGLYSNARRQLKQAVES